MFTDPPQLLLLGDSITAGFDTARLLPELRIRNEGVSGDSTTELLARLQPEWLRPPELRAVFMCIGTNDLARNRTDAFLLSQTILLARIIRVERPLQLYLTSLFPTRHNEPRPNPRIVGYNRQLAELADELGLGFFNLHPHFTDATGQLRAEFTDDGLHLTEAAYAHWAALLRQFNSLTTGS